MAASAREPTPKISRLLRNRMVLAWVKIPSLFADNLDIKTSFPDLGGIRESRLSMAGVARTANPRCPEFPRGLSVTHVCLQDARSREPILSFQGFTLMIFL
jgi:hypothetical protein